MDKKISVKILTEGGIMIALATVLSFVKVYQAPFGGSITAGSMIPILLFSLRQGMGPGLLVGAIYGIIQLSVGYVLTPAQAFLDYIVAFGLLGLAGLAQKSFSYIGEKVDVKNYMAISLGVLLGIGGRFVAHFFAGVIFFSQYAGDMNPWWYSALYNGSYLLPELIISTLLILLIWKPLSRMGR